MNKKEDPYVQAFEILCEFEKKAEPFRFYYKNFPVWLALRQSVCYILLQNITSSQNINTGFLSRERQIREYEHMLFKRFSSLDRSILLNYTKMKDRYLFFSEESYRKKSINGLSFNMFIDPLRITDKNNECIGIEFVSNPYRLNLMTEERFYTYNTYDLFFLRAIAYIYQKILCKTSRMPIHFDDKFIDLLEEIGVRYNTLEILMYNFVSVFEVATKYWKIVFELTKPRLITGIGWYSLGNMLMHFTANRMGIPTFELMHGIIIPYHVGYIYRNLNKDYRLQCAFPKYIIVYGRYFKDVMVKEGTLWEKENILDFGSPWLDYFLNNIDIDNKKLRGKLNVKDKNILMITSGEESTQEVFKKMLSELKIPNNWEVIIKIHPAEFLSWKKVYGELISKSGLKFVTDEEVNVYELLRISKAHASFFSSVLWEAPAFGVSNYVIDHSTKNIVGNIVELGLAKVSKIQDIFTDDFKPNKEVIDYIFSNLDGSSSQKVWEFFKEIS